MKRISEFERAYKTAMLALARAIAEKFPAGTRVKIRRGGGVMRAVVLSGPCGWTEPTRLVVASQNGKHLTADYKDCVIDKERMKL